MKGAPQQVPGDLALTSFPFEVEDAEELAPSTSGRFRGLLNRFFTESTPEASTTRPQVVPNITNSVSTAYPEEESSENHEGSPLQDVNNTEPRLVDYDGTVFKRHWMPDSAVHECYECHERFTTFRRRHHCRFCGQIFCGKCCSKQVPGAELGYTGLLRLCNYCFEKVLLHFNSEEGPTRVQAPVQYSPKNKKSSIKSIRSNSIDLNTKEEDSIPDLLNEAEKPNVNVKPYDVPQLDSLQAYEPCVDDSEPDWVKTLHNDIDPSANVFAPAATLTPNETQSMSNSEPTKFEIKADFVSSQLNSTTSQLFETKANALFDYLFEYEQVPSDVWKPLLVPLIQEVVNVVNVDTELRPKFINILDYVHIKKLCVDVPPSVEKVNGVVFSKALHHKSMSRYGENASVLLLSGSISYERVTEKMSSLEPILQQEHEYLRNQVQRIASRKVNLVFVEHNVSTVVVDLFLASQIGLCAQVKASVLERLSRCTGSDVITSLDAQFLQPRVGYCPRYYDRTVRLANGKEKQLMILDECDGSLGVSIVIRAPSMRELKAVKRILQLMLQVQYSNRCEMAFIQLFSCRGPLQMSACEVCAENQRDDADGPEATEFSRFLKSSELTNSPLIRIVPPYLARSEGQDCFLLEYLKKPAFHFYTKEDLSKLASAERSVEEQVHHLTSETEECKKALMKRHQHSAVTNKHLTTTDIPLTKYRARAMFLTRRCTEVRKDMDSKAAEQGQLYRKQTFAGIERPSSRNPDVLNPYKHQKRAFLYCAEGASRRWQNSGSFCSGPSVLVWRFYSSGEDMTVGTFLKKFCFNADYKCKECDKGMVEHFRKIIHHNTCIDITTQMLTAKLQPSLAESCPLEDFQDFDVNVLISWRYCRKCNAKSKYCSPSNLVLDLSFSKFVDYLSNAVHWTCDLFDERGNQCSHCTFHEHEHLFLYQGMVTVFAVTLIKPLHVLFAPMLCRHQHRPVASRSLVTEFNELRRLSAELFQEVRKHCTEPAAGQLLTTLHNYCVSLTEEFDEDGSIETSDTVMTNNAVYVKSDHCLLRLRHFLSALVDEWNDRRNAPNVVELDTVAKLKNICAKFSVLTPNEGTTQSDPNLTQLDTNCLLKTESTNVCKVETDAKCLTFPNPFDKSSHLELPIHKCSVPIVVRDVTDLKSQPTPDIGSVIAFALSSRDYAEKRRQLRNQGSRSRNSSSTSSFTAAWSPSTINASQHGFPPMNTALASLSSTADPFLSDESSQASVEVDFADSKAHYYVKGFHTLRNGIFPEGEEQFLRSISTADIWSPQGGKSGATFYRTKDERFMFKQMSRLEMESFKNCAPNYFDYINKALNEKKLTALCKIFGVFRVGYTSKTGNSQLKMDVLVMEYLFYGKNVKQLWDLKGSLRNRYASAKSDMPVLLDENLVQDLWGNQLYVHHHSKVALKQAISNDSSFLSSQDIMDYSLLAGVCQDDNEVVVGIVDYMRTYTLDKRVESLVKTALPSSHLPTVISPENYRKRFCDAIDCYFAMAPDQWTCLDSNVAT